MVTRRLSLPAARRVAVAAQGLSGPRPSTVDPRALRRAISRMGVLQIDTVNVFERSHYLPLLSRLGPYDRGLLDALLHHDGTRTLGRYTEYVAHEAAILPVDDWPLWHWHRTTPKRPGRESWADQNRALVDDVYAEFVQRGPLRINELEHPDNVATAGGWWNKNDVHWAATYLFRQGDLVVVGRDRFQRVLAATELVVSEEARRKISRDDAIRELVRRAAAAHGVATLDDLADYPRLKIVDARRAVKDLVAAGELEPVTVDGWGREAWLAAGRRVPREVSGAALLSPFDPLVWHRPRAERLFDFHYRISIYTPAAQREHGYYVLPVLVDGEIVGRIDLKSDRQAGVLRVQHAHIEPTHAVRSDELAGRVVPLLEEAAHWQGLGKIVVTGPGTWASSLARRL